MPPKKGKKGTKKDEWEGGDDEDKKLEEKMKSLLVAAGSDEEKDEGPQVCSPCVALKYFTKKTRLKTSLSIVTNGRLS